MICNLLTFIEGGVKKSDKISQIINVFGVQGQNTLGRVYYDSIVVAGSWLSIDETESRTKHYCIFDVETVFSTEVNPLGSNRDQSIIPGSK